jgi:serine/threonine protein kinase
MNLSTMQAHRKGQQPTSRSSEAERKRRRLSESFGTFRPERYLIADAHLGKGRSSSVVPATQVASNAKVAIKVFRADVDEKQHDHELHAAIELGTLRKLQPHPHIIALVEERILADGEGKLHMVMEVAEWDWAAFIHSRHASLAPLRQLKGYAQQATLALEYCHARGVTHRDVKPENLLITAGNVVKLADFGISKWEMQRYEQNTEMVTTRWYRAPEVLVCHGRYDYRIDVWSLALTIVELLTLRPVLPGNSEAHQLEMVYDFAGTPTVHEWDPKVQVALRRSYTLEKRRDIGIGLRNHAAQYGRARFMDSAAQALLAPMLALFPGKRCTASDALKAEFFTTTVEERKPYDSTQMIHYVRGSGGGKVI